MGVDALFSSNQKQMKKVFLSTCLMTLMACGSQKTISEESNNTTSEITSKSVSQTKIAPSPLLAKGNITKEELAKMTWYGPSYESYHPDEALVKTFRKALNKRDYQIDVYMGTWCHDSRRVVPKLIKLLEMTGSDFSNLTIVSVNGRKEIPDVSPEIAAKLNVHRVPTIIFYENGKEVDRFVERARESLLQDLIKIASGEEYLDSYER